MVGDRSTYNDGIRRFPLNGGRIPEVRGVGDLIMPLFHLDAQSDDFSHVEVECGPVLVFPDPYLVGVVTAGRLVVVWNDKGSKVNSQSSAVEKKVRWDENIVEKLYTNCGGSVQTPITPRNDDTYS